MNKVNKELEYILQYPVEDIGKLKLSLDKLEISPQALDRLIDLLELDIDIILDEKEENKMFVVADDDYIKNNPYIKRIPGVVFLRKLGSIKAGHPSFLSDENNEVIYIPIPSNYINGELSNCKTQKQIDEHFFIVEVVGDSMYYFNN